MKKKLVVLTGAGISAAGSKLSEIAMAFGKA
jgi:hypothetical protein